MREGRGGLPPHPPLRTPLLSLYQAPVRVLLLAYFGAAGLNVMLNATATSSAIGFIREL